ncbi:DUF4124 domain-containing protein [Shewanella sp. SR44-3]|uniref:DUF4124 domain-containing protein n=1 Tax=unclassified Shewanella TaxID=196818 RepID=UPI0015FBB594|nr:DUF4124 domain-containing protein [Shewanella sp. SR44-3]MBB1270495.1 DUF4124 domain-containing protein [Shewanella sp. SR44-3]
MLTLRPLVILFSTIAILCLSLSTSATVIYSWVDKDGKTHYSQEPPAEANAERQYSEDIERDKIGYVAPIKKTTQSSDEALRQAEALVIKEKDSKQADSICDNATHSLKVLTTHSNLNRKNEQTGEVVTMTEVERQAAIKENQERVKLFCQP